MEVFLSLNGLEIVCDIDDQEQVMLNLAAGLVTREQLEDWLAGHTMPLSR